ncbi:hypothetical protein CRX72_14855 [Pantoea sp. BRM17]|nr:hypothetical protein CRX72_14855 [Pantoea sp. BRM17]
MSRQEGPLVAKMARTPEYYPLSLNGVVAACNQKSNREPVMTLSEEEVQAQLDELVKKHLVTASSGASQRVSKYAQRFCNWLRAGRLCKKLSAY